MGKFYSANNEFRQYLINLGFTFHDREEPAQTYYTHHISGKQILVDTENNLVTLLDCSGRLVDYSSSYTDNQINEFLKD